MPILIKRYENRKLYNTHAKRYITLNGIAALIKQGEEIIVIDNSTGEETTAVLLSQIIFEQQKKQSGFLPLVVLSSLVRVGGTTIGAIRQNLLNSLGLLPYIDDEISKRVNILIEQGVFTQEDGNEFVVRLIDAGQQLNEKYPILEGKFQGYLRAQGLPAKSDFQSLIRQIEILTNRVEEIGGKIDQS
jgi:polyhydroxyalkanoate synthesis repressor PhaR